MKHLAAFAAVIAFCAGVPHSMTPGDNSLYVEGESRYIWIPDGDGVPHLVDLEQRVQFGPLSINSGAKNEYWLYTRENPTTPQIIGNGDNDTLLASNYQAHKPLKVIVHGWMSDGGSSINTINTGAFLRVMDCNVIVVDWSKIASKLFYWNVAEEVPNVGQHLGSFLEWVLKTAGGDWNKVHLVGFSLGAHVVGNAGRTVGGRIARITGLDPAGPIFGNNANALKADDAQHVEAIHTDGGALGIFDPIGLVNFYPNGGRNSQPGCWLSTCSHSRAYELFASSVYTNHFVGQRCANLDAARSQRCNGTVFLNMGNSDLSKQGEGIFSVSTGKDWPF